MKNIYILGVGHNTPVYIELAELLGYQIKGLYHYHEGRNRENILGYEIIGTNDDLLEKEDLTGDYFALSMGDSRIRVKLADAIRSRGGAIPLLIHPNAAVSKYALLDDGVVVHANATIQANVKVGRDSVISFNVGITHDAVIKEGVYVAGSSIVGAYVCVGRMAFIGMAAVVVSSKVKSIGEFATVGAGAVVTKDVLPYATVVGNPAKKIGA